MQASPVVSSLKKSMLPEQGPSNSGTRYKWRWHRGHAVQNKIKSRTSFQPSKHSSQTNTNKGTHSVLKTVKRHKHVPSGCRFNGYRGLVYIHNHTGYSHSHLVRHAFLSLHTQLSLFLSLSFCRSWNCTPESSHQQMSVCQPRSCIKQMLHTHDTPSP